MNKLIDQNWYLLQDVNDTCEKLKLFETDSFITEQGPQISEWEPVEKLKHLQLLFSEHPYWGRELRYFNDAPWWYKNEFEADALCDHYELFFSNVDYYCKVWLNGRFVGEHEGYSAAFQFNVDGMINRNGSNRLVVKVWSPWETKIEDDEAGRRTFKVERNMVKGTYEHSDTFVARDVNPVGIYGDVILKQYKKAWFDRKPEFCYSLDETLCRAQVSLNTNVKTTEKAEVHFLCRDHLTNEIRYRSDRAVSEDGAYSFSGEIADIHLWNIWDRGTPYTYDIEAWIEVDGEVVDCYHELTGFREIEMKRTEDETSFILNHKKIYVRGTSYFPDNYISAMNKERYKDDLLKMKSCGFNFIRVHVHVELPEFYQLCTEMGMGIIQDSEYNWTHPGSDAFAERFIRVFLENVDQLKKYPAVLCWICMNEPAGLDADDAPNGENSYGRAMDISPGPALYEAVCAHDPSRPAIKGFFCENDLLSGDSHNYIGSLCGEQGHYTDIYGMCEKLNTEYGFDAPPCADNLMKVPAVYKRLRKLDHKMASGKEQEATGVCTKDDTPSIDSIGEYQYRLLKYYTEYYRMQKYEPNAGYVQFLFSDIGPTSYYGIYDWWGTSKRGLDAMLESNMPIGIFMGYQDQLVAVYVVNDHAYDVGECEAVLVVTDLNGNELYKASKEIVLLQDSRLRVFEINRRFGDHISVALVLKKGEQILAGNRYEDLYNMPAHVKGHPARMSHEFGIRLYDC